MGRRRDYSPGKTKYDASAAGCPDPRYPDLKLTPLGYFCYPAPRSGFQCQLTACQSICPPLMTQCGPAACALSAETCGANIGQMVVDVSLAVVQTAGLIASFGATGAGGNQAVSAASQTAFKSAAKRTIKKFQNGWPMSA